MGYIEQSGSGISDSSLVSASLWIRPPSGVSLAISVFDMVPSGSFQDFIIEYDGGTNEIIYGSSATSLAPCAQWATNSGVITSGAWYHIALSCDVGHANADPKIGCCVINAVNRMASSAPSVDDPSQAAGSARSYQFLWNGSTIGIPDIGANMGFGTHPAIQYGDFQLWVGQYIDWTNSTNFAKVVSISGGVGTPVNPATAATAFGTQTLLFKGNATQFVTNAGNGGAFTKTGTASDYTPAPSY
jgi:hypothetical protein